MEKHTVLAVMLVALAAFTFYVAFVDPAMRLYVG
jgi:hypothetical protein